MNVHNPAASEFEAGASRTGAASWLPQAAANALDLQRWALAFRRRWRLLGAVALAIFAATVLLTLQATPRYTASASVALDMRKENVSGNQQVLADLPADSSVVDTEVEVIKSRQLADRVTRALDLDHDPEFNGALRKPTGMAGVIGGIKSLFGAAAPSRRQPSEAQIQRMHEGVVSGVLGHLGVQRLGLTYVININYQSESPAKAAMIANKYAELYLLSQLQDKFDATQQATRWLNDQLEHLRQQVLQDEAAVQQYKIENNLLSTTGATLTEQEVSSYSQTLAQARAQVAEDEGRLAAAKMQLGRAANGGDVGEALNSALIQGLRTQRASISANLAELQGRYGDRYPDVVKAKRQLADIDAQIQQEIQTIIANLEAKVQVSKQREGAMAGSLGGAKGTLAANNRSMVRLNELQRTADASRTIYESYLNRFKETSTQGALGQADARILSKAATPGAPSSPNVSRNIMLGLMLALAGGLGSVVLVEILDAGLATADDVERRLGAPYLGSIPVLSSVAEDNSEAPIDYVVSKPLSGFAESFRSLQAAILHARVDDPVKVVAITSALPGEGKTLTAMCLARSAALQGRRVLIIDCDLRRRTVNRMLQAEPQIGLLEVLNGEATLQQATSLDAASGAHVLPLAASKFTPRDVFGSSAMDRLLAEVRGRYDLVVLDTAPVLPVADTRVLAPKADLVVFLARWRKTPEPAIQAAFRMLDSPGVILGGVVLTLVDMKQQAKYGYGDPGYYYAEYKKYYVT
ncbi:MAG: capsular biosynthesis protein [Phenylobacterium sp.]|nr:MAG: capsular biosynthesis protein [Phenylobacterium sp.]